MQLVSLTLLHWMVIYPMDSTIQLLNNWGLKSNLLTTTLPLPQVCIPFIETFFFLWWVIYFTLMLFKQVNAITIDIFLTETHPIETLSLMLKIPKLIPF